MANVDEEREWKEVESDIVLFSTLESKPQNCGRSHDACGASKLVAKDSKSKDEQRWIRSKQKR